MRAELDGRTVRTRALDLRGSGVTASAVAAAVRDPNGWVTCRRPGPAHEHVGVLDGTGFALDAALAAAARSRGCVAPEAPELAAVREELTADVPRIPDLAAARERVADASADVTALRERVERLGGKVAALRDVDRSDAAVVADHRTAAMELTDAETERTAAVETVTRLEREAEAARDVHERRLRLEDAQRRLERAARASLVAAVRPSFERARRAVPDAPPTWRDALAVARVARLGAPVVVVDGPFDRARRAAACLDAEVVLVRADV